MKGAVTWCDVAGRKSGKKVFYIEPKNTQKITKYNDEIYNFNLFIIFLSLTMTVVSPS